MVSKAKAEWNLKKVQIALDGTEEVYNRIKAYEDSSQNAFERVLGNMDTLLETGIRVRVRLNMDSKNAEDICELIDLLGKRYKGKKGFSAYIEKLLQIRNM